MRTGLLLGAGASYENGMPLVWDLTAELRAWLTTEKLAELNRGWTEQGSGLPAEVLNSVLRCINSKSMHYESMVGHIEVEQKRSGKLLQEYNQFHGWLVDIIYALLYYRHAYNTDFILAGLRFIEGIVGLSKINKPLWVFSLNHDLLIECLAAKYSVPLNTGLPDDFSVPTLDSRGKETGRIAFNKIDGEKYENNGLIFPQGEDEGINLLKIHGSLDTFTTRDGKDLVKIAHAGHDASSIIANLRKFNDEVFFPAPGWHNGRVKLTGEVAYPDENGVMQFLRRSLLTGVFKFDQVSAQVLPKTMLGHFRINLNRVDHLIAIGYGFGDMHINSVVRDWLEFSGHRRLSIVSPGGSIPGSLLHLDPQIELVDKTAVDFLEDFALSPLTLAEKAIKEIRNQARKHHKRVKGFG